MYNWEFCELNEEISEKEKWLWHKFEDDNLEKEWVGKDPEKYFLKTRIWEKKVFSLFSFCILQLMLDSNYFLSIWDLGNISYVYVLLRFLTQITQASLAFENELWCIVFQFPDKLIGM